MLVDAAGVFFLPSFLPSLVASKWEKHYWEIGARRGKEGEGGGCPWLKLSPKGQKKNTWRKKGEEEEEEIEPTN